MSDKLAVDLATTFEFSDGKRGSRFGVSLATLLQCLCIAETHHLVPPLDPDWERDVIPEKVREFADPEASEADPRNGDL